MTDNLKAEKKTMVLGIGNVIMGDEGFGLYVIRRLKEIGMPENIKLEEGGVGGFNLLNDLEGIKQLIVVDIMMVPLPPGELQIFKPGNPPSEPGKVIVSFHQVGVLELVNIWGLMGKKEPDVTFLVTRPQTIDWGTELSQPLKSAVEKAARMIKTLCADFN
ncbi:MAG: hydrogenase maturation protease [Dehalococcoidales bacterium]|nr:hydrogenase maturation protease [Dehalococcoidales bacterium]